MAIKILSQRTIRHVNLPNGKAAALQHKQCAHRVQEDRVWMIEDSRGRSSAISSRDAVLSGAVS